MSDPIDISRLRDLARSATPGPWTATRDWSALDDILNGWHLWGARDFKNARLVPETEANARYLAALDPTTVLALIGRLERAENLSEAMSLKARLIQEAHERALNEAQHHAEQAGCFREALRAAKAERDEARATIQRALLVADECEKHGNALGGSMERAVGQACARAIRQALS